MGQNCTEIACAQSAVYWAWYDGYIGYYESRIYFVICFFGILGSILILFTLMKNKNLSEPSFMCYQTIAWIESVYCLFAIPIMYDQGVGAAPKLYQHNFYEWSYLINRIAYPLLDLFGSITYCLISFLSIQRAVACLIPTKYDYFDGKRVCLGVIIGFVLINAIFWVPQLFGVRIFFNNQRNRYDKSYDLIPDAYFEALEMYRLVLAVIIGATTVAAIVGILRATALK